MTTRPPERPCTCRPRLSRLRIRLRRTSRGWSASYRGWAVEVWDEPSLRREAIESLRHFVCLRVAGDSETGWHAIGQSAECPRNTSPSEVA